MGLTGGIATGKSTVSALLGARGIPVLDADHIAREVVLPGTKTLQALVDAFGDGILAQNGMLDRAALGRFVFHDATARERVNAIMHPAIRSLMVTRARALEAGNRSRVIILDVPLLFEGEMHRVVDVTVLVYASRPQQLQRLMKRNQLTDSEANARIDAQMSTEQKRRMATIIVENDGSLSGLQARVDRLCDVLAEFAREVLADEQNAARVVGSLRAEDGVNAAQVEEAQLGDVSQPGMNVARAARSQVVIS